MRLTPSEETLLFRAAKHYSVPTSKLILLSLAHSSDLAPDDYFNALLCLRKLSKDTTYPTSVLEIDSLIKRIERFERQG
jgi:hypothetical protein